MRTVRERANQNFEVGTALACSRKHHPIACESEQLKQEREFIMRKTDLERFVNDLGKKGSPLENAKRRVGGLASIVAIGKSLNYNITLDEVKSYIRSNSRQKSSTKKLGAIAGRKRRSSVPALTSFVQTTALANSADVSMSPAQLGGRTGFAAVVLIVVIVVVVAT
ncbi:hypothetical protein [Mesorhizobium sp. M0488]|uniref:hypothetical protein n=1 Tax=unclassified Mesorhizobium TaxID=325217 RepID=UPI003334FF9F